MEPRTALLVMDMQSGITKSYPAAAEIIGNISKAIAKARESKIPVIYIIVGFRTGTPEISPNNKLFSAAKERLVNKPIEEYMKIEAGLTPRPEDITVIKRRISAFTGSDLEVVLRAQGIQHLVLTGISTSGVVLSTLREAADKDYQLTVLSDCCCDLDEEVHRVLTTKVFVRQADVLTANEWNE